jgi:hypothetical protein
MAHATKTSARTSAGGRTRRLRTLAGALGLAIGLSGVGAAAASQASAHTRPYCGITWGSLAKQDRGENVDAPAEPTTRGVRAGRHACFDRFVIDGAGSARVRYVDQVREDGSGNIVPLRGGARLEIVTTSGVTGSTGQIEFLPPRSKRANLVDVTGYRTFRQVAYAGDFEGQLTLGLGVRARLPFRVFVLESNERAPRVVIDVAHRW